MSTHMLQITVDADLEREAAAALDTEGLTVADAVRMMLRRIAAEGSLPQVLHYPNEKTLEAMRAADRGEVQRFETTEAMMDFLNAPD